MERVSCHENVSPAQTNKNQTLAHPDHSAEKKRVRRIQGQINGVQRMIDERRYCIEIVTQIKAATSALQSLERAIVETHLRGCVRAAFTSKNAFDIESKVKEIMDVIL